MNQRIKNLIKAGELNRRLEDLKKTSRILSVVFAIFMAYAAALYIANTVCLVVAPGAPIMGKVTHTETTGANGHGSSEFYESFGEPRTFLEPSGEGHSLVLKIGRSQTSWRAVNSDGGNWNRAILEAGIVYFIYLSLFFGVLLKGLNHLRKLFSYFARGVIFTPETVREINRFGQTVLMWAGVDFLGSVVVIIVSRIFHEAIMSAIELPFLILFAGFLISLVAAVFAEGQRLSEDSALTI
jgi:Protein of unknown function (DUF2975)